MGALNAQDTTVLSSFNYNSTTRDTMIDFPTGNESYRKILMLYNMRCKGARVSTGSSRNLGCGEWDYSCNTYITDSTRRDSFLSSVGEHSVSSYSGTNFNYAINPIYDYFRSVKKTVNVQQVFSENSAAIGQGNTPNSDFLFTNGSKTQVIYTAAELNGNGLAAGMIKGLGLFGTTAGSVTGLRIKLGATGQSLKTNFLNIPLQEVFYDDAYLNLGETHLQFYDSFFWDGASNIILEVSCAKADASLALRSFALGSIDVATAQNGTSLYFDGATYLQSTSFPGILGANERTIDVWIKSKTVNGEICSWGRDRAGEKWVFRVNENGALRVEVNGGNIIGTTLLTDNKWHHVACVFKGTQVTDIKLFVDGTEEVVASSTNRSINTTIGTPIRISRGINNRYFVGEMEQLRVWDKALTTGQINEVKHCDAIPAALSLNLKSQVNFDDLNGELFADDAPGAADARLYGNDQRRAIFSDDLFAQFKPQSTMRPYASFYQGYYAQTVNSTTVLDSMSKIKNYHRKFKVKPNYGAIYDDSVVVIEQNVYWNAEDITYFYDENGQVYDSAQNTTDGTVNLTTNLQYYRRYPSSLEIMSFVTPYGINLDLGPTGKTWVFDMTDFTPILKGKKRMFMSRGGQWQEEMDIKFLFIKGTPEREVKDIKQIWPTSFVTANYNQILANTNYFPPVQVPVNNENYKIRSAITGHGQQGEFIPREHSIIVDNQTFTQRVWKECAENPVFPQGGTWIYDRAGWCPGMATDVAEYNVTDLAKGKNSITVDYTIDAGQGDSRYIINNQLVTYGDWESVLDASVSDIVSPSNRVEYQKTNPTCVNPAIKIKNMGSDTLTNVTVEYWVNDKTYSKTDVWHGNLIPGAEAVHPLPVEQEIWLSASGENDRFYATIKLVNGRADQNAANDLAVSDFVMPDMVPNHIVLFMRGNAAGSETSVTLTDDWGQLIYHRGALGVNQLYRDTVRLGSGCHKLTVQDADDDGLSFFANNDGSGFVRILKVGGGYNKTLQSDHGDGVSFSFTVNHPLSMAHTELSDDITCFPNPSNGIVFLDGTGLEKASIQVYNNLGKRVNPVLNLSNDNARLDFSKLPVGFYSISIQIGVRLETKKVIIYH